MSEESIVSSLEAMIGRVLIDVVVVVVVVVAVVVSESKVFGFRLLLG